MMRLSTNGPRSFTNTSALRPLARLVTCTQVGSGSVRLAAVKARGLKRSPMDVVEPDSQPYHDACPCAS